MCDVKTVKGCCPCPALPIAGVTILVGGLVAMLACGILGVQGKIPMSTVGAKLCIRLPVSVFGSVLIIGAVIACKACKS